MSNVIWHFSNEHAQWQKKICTVVSAPATLEENGQRYQRMEGFGGCFNELGYRADQVHAPAARGSFCRGSVVQWKTRQVLQLRGSFGTAPCGHSVHSRLHDGSPSRYDEKRGPQ